MATANLPNAVLPTDLQEMQKLLERAQEGDESTVPALQELLKAPHLVEACGNLASHAEHTLIQKFAGKDLTVREGLLEKVHSMRTELAGPAPAPLERLLVERIVTCWLHLNHLEMGYGSKDSMSLELAQHYEKCIDRAHKRHLSAIKTLAVVRRLALPVLQVNIANKQKNVAG